MSKKRRWTIEQLKKAADESTSLRQILFKLGLIPAGGNYEQIKKYLKENSIDYSHFTGKVWNKGRRNLTRSNIWPLEKIMVKGKNYQSHRLRLRLLKEKIKKPKCELCGWAKFSEDGRLPLELNHMNGDHSDNRLENLQILCPNCHSLQLTHRGCNRKNKIAAVV
ncbi:MAG: HNH endonuclease signature motif containing protein [bacterium]|nr:HNH endonuclease signature motif containing protein [bacterium]